LKSFTSAGSLMRSVGSTAGQQARKNVSTPTESNMRSGATESNTKGSNTKVCVDGSLALLSCQISASSCQHHNHRTLIAQRERAGGRGEQHSSVPALNH